MPGFMEPAKEVPVKGESRDSHIIKNQNEPAEAAASIEAAGLALSCQYISFLGGEFVVIFPKSTVFSTIIKIAFYWTWEDVYV